MKYVRLKTAKNYRNMYMDIYVCIKNIYISHFCFIKSMLTYVCTCIWKVSEGLAMKILVIEERKWRRTKHFICHLKLQWKEWDYRKHLIYSLCLWAIHTLRWQGKPKWNNAGNGDNIWLCQNLSHWHSITHASVVPT